MSNTNFRIVKPINVKEYDFKQSKYEVAPKLPFSMITNGPSGSGKGILLQSLILDIYRDVFARIMSGPLRFPLTLIGHPLSDT